MMNFFKTKGIVIKKIDFGEADRIITIFSENFGKLEVLVKGIRKSKKREISAVEILSYSEFTLYRKDEKYILSSVDLLEYFLEIRSDLEKLEIVSYMLSLINKIIFPGEKRREFFKRVKNALEFIKNNEKNLNYYLILRMLIWIIKTEGLSIQEKGKKYLEIATSSIVDTNLGKGIELEKNVYRLITLKLKKDEIVNEEQIIEAILLCEKYLNYHLDIKLNFVKYLFGGNSC